MTREVAPVSEDLEELFRLNPLAREQVTRIALERLLGEAEKKIAELEEAKE
jgi:hypothetical protein